MKVKAAQTALNEAIGRVSRAISTKGTIPVLSGIHLSTGDGVLWLRATDMETSIESACECAIEETGAVVVPGAKLAELVKRIPGGNIDLATTAKSGLVLVKWGSAKYELPSSDPETFPQRQNLEGAVTLAMPGTDLRRILERTVYAADNNPAKPWQGGVVMTLTGQVLSTMATDNAALTFDHATVENSDDYRFTIIVPKGSAQDIARLLNNSEVVLYATGGQFGVKQGHTTVLCRLISDQPMNPSGILPKEFQNQSTCKRMELMEAIERASTVNWHMKFGFNGSGVSLNTSTPDGGKVEEQVPATSDGEPLTVTLDAKRIHAYLRVIASEEVTFGVVSTTKPVRVVPVGDTGSSVYIMPLITV